MFLTKNMRIIIINILVRLKEVTIFENNSRLFLFKKSIILFGFNKYKIKAVLIDPTPRAIEHIEKIIEALGKSNTEEFLEGGNQPIEAYNLKNISEDDFTFIKKALFNKSNEIIKFFAPPNPNHVSHSISNW